MIRTRLAPTPSGLLHAGNALSFIVTWLIARSQGGWILLRIDDLDRARRRPEYVDDIFRTLEWLGLDYDEGPAGPDDLSRHWSQHLRLEAYHRLLEDLAQGGHLYACRCSRREIQAISADGLYPGTCRLRGRPLTEAGSAWRIRVPEDTRIDFREWEQPARRSVELARELGDFVVRQKNGLPAYQVASLADDLHWKIDFIVRGEDLLASTAAQCFLALSSGRPAFTETVFWHHGLLTDEQGGKLSKSQGAASLQAWREQGRSPEELFRQAAEWLRLPPLGNLSELLAAYSGRTT